MFAPLLGQLCGGPARPPEARQGRPAGRPAVSVRWRPASGVSALYCLVPVNTSFGDEDELNFEDI